MIKKVNFCNAAERAAVPDAGHRSSSEPAPTPRARQRRRTRARHERLPVDGAVRRLAGLGLRRLRRPAVQLRRAQLRADAAGPADRLAGGEGGDAALGRHPDLAPAARLGGGRHPVRPGRGPHRAHAHADADDAALRARHRARARPRPTSGCWSLFRIVASLGIGGEWAAGAAMVAEVVPEKRRVEAGALLYTSAPVGPVPRDLRQLPDRRRAASRARPRRRGATSSCAA